MPRSVASPVLPTRAPALLPLGAVEDGLAQLLVDIVVGVAQPLAKLAAAAGLDGIFLYVALEVVGADPARVQAGEEPDEADQVVLLGRVGGGRVRGGYRVEECPCAPSESLNVGWAVGRRGGGDCARLGWCG